MRGLEQIPWLYDAFLSFGEWTGLGKWRQWLVEGTRGRCLDLGSGTGRNLPLYPAGTTVIALDPAEETMVKARRRAPQVGFVRASAEALPFRDGAFDTVVCGLVFCSIPDPQRGLSEVRRVMRPDASLRMLEHVRSTRPFSARLQDLVQPAWTCLAGGCHPNRDTEQSVLQAGFVIAPEGRQAAGNMRRFTARKGS